MNNLNSMTVKSKIVSDFRIEYEFEITGEWKKYFTNKTFYVEYSQPINPINESIAIIPVLGTILPISWIFDANVNVEEIDEMFYNSIPEFKNGYVNMFQTVDFKGRLSAKKIIKNESDSQKVAALFSGGVDAFNTLFAHIDEKPDLITIWGADISDDNEEGWSVVKQHREDTLKLLNLGGAIIKTSMRKCIQEAMLTEYVRKTANDNWWHGFHHGIGMFALTAPIAYINGYRKLYVASSFWQGVAGQYTAASDPTIDNYVKFCDCCVSHDGYEFNRQDKIHNICEYSKKHNIKIPVRACWESSDGSNCCKCEKCGRTILGFYAEKEDPADFGFLKWRDTIAYFKKTTLQRMPCNIRYNSIQKRLKENYSRNEVLPELRWFYDTNLNSVFNIYFLRRKIKIFFTKPLLKILVKAKKYLKKAG